MALGTISCTAAYKPNVPKSKRVGMRSAGNKFDGVRFKAPLRGRFIALPVARAEIITCCQLLPLVHDNDAFGIVPEHVVEFVFMPSKLCKVSAHTGCR